MLKVCIQSLKKKRHIPRFSGILSNSLTSMVSFFFFVLIYLFNVLSHVHYIIFEFFLILINQFKLTIYDPRTIEFLIFLYKKNIKRKFDRLFWIIEQSLLGDHGAGITRTHLTLSDNFGDLLIFVSVNGLYLNLAKKCSL